MTILKGTDYKSIKERLKRRAMGLWGIEDMDKIDPVIEMLLDVFAYELARVNDEIKISDGKLLERLARILVDDKWSLPSPSHALLKMLPIENELEVHRKSQFYYPKMEQGEVKDIFFTPIKSHKLLNAYVRCLAFSDKIVVRDEEATTEYMVNCLKDTRIDDHAVWVGIKIDKELLGSQKKLPICLLLKDSELDSHLKTVQVQDSKGNSLEIQGAVNDEESHEQEHYFEMIDRYYQNYLYEIDIEDAKKKQNTISAQFSEFFDPVDLEDFDEKLFWIKLILPITFDREELEKLEVTLNVFPIVNRRYVYKQHYIARNGRLVSLPTDIEGHDFFLNLESLQDDNGAVFTPVLDSDINDLSGTYSLYFGNADRFDQRNAKGMLDRMLHTVREEGSAFSAIGYDLLNTHLNDLNSKLDVLEQKVNTSYKNIIGSLEKQYLITEPHENTTSYECEFWKTNGAAANGISEDTSLSQYQSVELQSHTISLQTETVGGIIRTTTKEKINSLRSGIITRERIVSKEDIKAFVKAMVGGSIQSVDVRSGVAISPKKKEGLVRTTHVSIEFSSQYTMNAENKKRMAHFIQSELEHRSVQIIPYEVEIS
ncbi:MAG: type VI secretion system baseplate subunit TssF [Crocinitomicaceae bacterium]|nr:hypothetical protein [Flavobacteriales bacterium]NQZ35591.1 type VI secretion system baseplate subunit TssF [Crocinitomicaceae bacterium]